jgi:chitinase
MNLSFNVQLRVARRLTAQYATRAALTATTFTLIACSDSATTLPVGPADSLGASFGKAPAVPQAPRSPVATAGDASATVQWLEPFKADRSAILSYRVTSTPGGITATVPASSLTATVTGLTNGTSYRFSVVAINAAGSSAASTLSNAVTPSAPLPPLPPPPAGSRWVSGYYVGYQRGLYPETSVDFSLMTHIIVGRIIPAADGSVLTHFDIDNTNGPAMARTLSSRAHAAGRKAILMLGGAGEHAGFVGAANNTNRAKFVGNLLRVMDDLGYDGIDVDWEPIETADRAPLLQLLKDLRAARPSILLSIPVGWTNANFTGVDSWYAEVAAQVQQMNLMTYDMAGPWGGWVSWHFSALQDHGADHPSSIASSVQQYLNVGIPAAKLGVGIGFYGACWRGVTGPRQALNGAYIVASDNTMSYRNIMTSYYTLAARRWDDAAKAGYLTFSTATGPQGCNFISYEDEQSIAAKGEFVRTRGLGGAIIWTIGQGHLPSAPAGSQDPLLKATYQGIVP